MKDIFTDLIEGIVLIIVSLAGMVFSLAFLTAPLWFFLLGIWLMTKN